jgi:calcineurin-like phosphoesterase family protein
MCIWLTSDSHLDHANILHLAGRNFANIKEHDETLIDAWCSRVGKDDDVYHLGDFTLAGPGQAMNLFSRLTGRIRVLGYPWHHDCRWLPRNNFSGFSNFFSASGTRVWIDPPIVVLEDVDVNADGRGVPMTLCHYVIESWDRAHYGAFHAHGHAHGKARRVANRLDVGVDSVYNILGEYRPIKLEEAIQIARAWREES